MADWSYGVNDPATIKRYSYKLFADAIPACVAYKLAAMGASKDSPDNIVQIFKDLEEGEGDEVKYDLVKKLTGAGVLGDNEIAGNEEAPQTFQSSLIINQLRHSTKPTGAMSQQRVPMNMRDVSKRELKDWNIERWDLALMNQLTGNTNQADVRFTGLNATVAPSNSYQIGANDKTLGTAALTEANLVAGDSFTLDLIDKCVAKGHTLNPPIKPVQLNGMTIFGVIFIHPLQTLSLRTNYSAGQWGDIQKAALTGGQITGNPIFSGAIGMYANVVIHEDIRVPYDTNAAAAGTNYNPLGVANVARAVFCGAQAACMAFGRAYGGLSMKWFEELLDAGNSLRVTAGSIYGIKKTQFNSTDWATITVSSYETLV